MRRLHGFTGSPNELLLLPAHDAVRDWLISFASRIVVVAPQQNCGR
jgi:hypothetical protein